jgi:hypothetical protein
VGASRRDLSKRSAPARRPFCKHIGINVGIKVTRVLWPQSATGQVSHDLRDWIAQVTKTVSVGCFVGIGSEIGRPSTIGLGDPPNEVSKPLRLKTIFISAAVSAATRATPTAEVLPM